MVKTCDEYSRICCRSGLTEINFRSKSMSSHVVQRFRRMLYYVLVDVPLFCSLLRNLRVNFVMILQNCYKKMHQSDQRIIWHRMLSSFVMILQACYKKIASVGPTHHAVLSSFVSSCKLVTKDSSNRNHRNSASHATIFCNHLAKLLQKIRGTCN